MVEQSDVVNPVGNISRPSAIVALKVFNLMDRWLTAIEADRSTLPHETKVTRNKPFGVFDACFVDGRMYEWRPDPYAKCNSPIPVFHAWWRVGQPPMTCSNAS